MKQKRTRGVRACHWIEKYCVVPQGPDRGRLVVLSAEQRETILRYYDNPARTPLVEPINGLVAAWLALLHTCGPEAPVTAGPPPDFRTDVFTVWNSAGPRMREVLKLDGERVSCPELGTNWPEVA